MFNLKIVHLNCYKLTEIRILQLTIFLKQFEPDIVSLQELKLNETEANLKIRFDSYVTYHKTRAKNGDYIQVTIDQKFDELLMQGLRKINKTLSTL